MSSKHCIILFLMCCAVPSVGRAGGAFFDVDMQPDSVYTPGRVTLTFQLKEAAVLAGEYQCRIRFFVEDRMLKDESVSFNRNDCCRAVFEFPEMDGKTICRCRAELFLDGVPLETKERFLTLYPFPQERLIDQRDAVIWVYDEAGALADKLREFNVDFQDAQFRLVQNFVYPDIIVIGENADPNGLAWLLDCYEQYYAEAALIVLKQRQIPFYPDAININDSKNFEPASIVCDYHISILDDIGPAELAGLVRKGQFLNISRRYETIINCIGRPEQSALDIESLLVYIKDGNRQHIFCQMPLLNEGPAGDRLLENLLNFGIRIRRSADPLQLKG